MLKNHETTKGYLMAVLMFFIGCLLIGGLAINAKGQTASIMAQWDYGKEPDVSHFRLFYGEETGKYAIGYSVPLADWVAPPGWMTLPIPLDPGTYYMAVTAVDTAGNESGYSNEAQVVVPNKPPAGCTGFNVKLQ